MASIPRIALIGVSGYARIYYEILSELADRGAIRLVAATIINQAQEPEATDGLSKRGCTIYEDYREMLHRHRSELELCCIPTGIAEHSCMTIAALESGANVLVEKPLAASEPEIRAIQAAERTTGRFVAVAFQDLYLPETLDLKEALLSGEIGQLTGISAIGIWPRNVSYYHRNRWAGRIKRDGAWILDSPISNAFGHFLNLALFLAGAKLHRSAAVATIEAEIYRAQPIESFDTAALRLIVPDGPKIHFYASHSADSATEPEVRICGTAGQVVWTYCRDFVIQSKDRAFRTVKLPGELQLRRVMFDRVLSRIYDDRVFICTTQIAAEHTRCVVAAHSASAIHDVPAQWLTRSIEGSPEKEKVTIVGLEGWLKQAYREGKLLNEIGCPWAVPARPYRVGTE